MRVAVVHRRWSDDRRAFGTTDELRRIGKAPHPKGGVTVALATSGDRSFRAEARCSDRDNFSRKVGRTIAVGRLAKALGLPRDELLSAAR